MGSLVTGVALAADGRPSAFVIVEERAPFWPAGGAVTYEVVHVEHLPAETSYPVAAGRVLDARVDAQRRRIVTRPGSIYVSAPAAGPDVVDVFRALDLDATYVEIVGGDGTAEGRAGRRAAGEIRLSTLIERFQVVLHGDRIDLSPRDGGGDGLADKLVAVEGVMTRDGGVVYQHTESVLIALWLAVRDGPVASRRVRGEE